MLLAYMGHAETATRLEKALEICVQFERNVVITGRSTGATAKTFTDYLLSWLASPDLDATHQRYLEATR
jgi:isocitrate dehydrogenase (NAD+)